jgi:hypothetical protein
MTAKFIGQAKFLAMTEQSLTVALSDEKSTIVAGLGKIKFIAPFNMLLTRLPKVYLATAATAGVTTVDVLKNGVSILSTPITVDYTNKSSVTAAVPAVIATNTFSEDDEIACDLDTLGTGAMGVKVTFYYKRA